MKMIALPALALLAAVPASAQDRAAEPAPRGGEAPRGCVLPQQIAPPFNNTAAAMEQSRIAANTVRRTHVRRGGALPPICGSEHDPRSLEPVRDDARGDDRAQSSSKAEPD